MKPKLIARVTNKMVQKGNYLSAPTMALIPGDIIKA
jgi:hypothetical protein